MGTNYYLHRNVCLHCGRSDEPRHIGKSSCGWHFALHVYPSDGINDLQGWVKELEKPDRVIKDEYDQKLTIHELLSVIRDRKRDNPPAAVPWGYNSWDHFHRSNQSQPGLNGLVRCQIGAGHCVKHGEGTWDCIDGDFS